MFASERCTLIRKQVGRWKRPKGIAIFENGWAMVLATDPNVCVAIRKHKEMREALGI